MPQNVLPDQQSQLLEMIMAQFLSRLVYVAAKLKLADHLAEGPRTAEELASLTQTHAPSLYRVLRTLASMGLFAEDTPRRFTLRPMGEALKSGTALHAAALVLAGELVARPLEHILYSVQTGENGFQKAFGMPVFEWLAGHPEDADLFNGTMTGFHGMEPAAVAAAYDFSGCGTIADVGGSTGNMLTTILGRHAGPRGILFDLPHVTQNAAALIEQRGLTDRIGIESGSFFQAVPSGADTYLLSHVIHDWKEDQCLTILRNCRQVMKPTGRLLLVEMILPGGDERHPGKMLDMMMLVASGGQERTEVEYNALLAKGGFKLTQVVPTASPVSVVEAAPC